METLNNRPPVPAESAPETVDAPTVAPALPVETPKNEADGGFWLEKGVTQAPTPSVSAEPPVATGSLPPLTSSPSQPVLEGLPADLESSLYPTHHGDQPDAN